MFTQTEGPKLVNVTGTKFKAKDTADISHVYIFFDEPHLINTLYPSVLAPSYYTRPITIYNGKTGDRVYIGTIKGPGSDYIYFSVKTRLLRLDITNGDDVPLTIKDISAFQQQRYIVSYLQIGHNYSIFTGDRISQSSPI